MQRRSRRLRPAGGPAIVWAPANDAPWSGRQLAVLLAIVVAAAALRLVNLERWSLGDDEVTTWRGITRSLAGFFDAFSGPDGHQPLVAQTLRFLAGSGLLSFQDEARLRLPFVFAGIVAVPTIALVGKRATGDAVFGLFAAALLALHPWHVLTSRNALPAGVAMLFVLGALGAMARPGTAPSRWRRVATVVAAVVAIGSHSAGWIVVPMLVVHALVARWSSYDPRERAIASVVVAGSPFLSMLAIYWSAGPSNGPGDGANGAASDSMAHAFAPFLDLASGLGGPVLLAASAAALLVRPLPALAVFPPAAGIVATLLVAAAGVPLSAGGAVVVLPFAILPAAAACRHLSTTMGADAASRIQSWVGAAIVPGALLVSLAVPSVLQATVYEGHRPRAADVATFLARSAKAGRGIAVAAGALQPVLTYYLRPNHWRDETVDPHPGRRVLRIDASRPLPLLDELAARTGEEVFVVLRRDELDLVDADPDAKAALASSFRLVDVEPTAFRAGRETLYVFRARTGER
ncbi:MAG: hypothetical protein JNK78_09715 [Planctomycetes bacterium]|nr:hypothetical protein [Planctomycetota bacterium]